MKSPVLSHKIDTDTRMNANNASSLNASRGANPALKSLGRQQSHSVMEVKVVSSGKTGGGRDVFGTSPGARLADLNNGSLPKIEASARLNSTSLLALPNGEPSRRVAQSVDKDGNAVDDSGQKYEDYFKEGKDDGEEFGRAAGFTNKFSRWMQKMGCGTSKISDIDQTMPVVVFGATGRVGGAVVRALLKDHRFCVRAVTRNPTTDQARALAEEGAVIVPADLNDTRSLTRAMEGVAGVFMTTNYWEHMSKQKEITQGMNAIDAAVSCNVHHFIFQGSEPTGRDEKSCGPMDAKAAIENYVRETSLPFTAVRFPFLYENYLTLFKPHLVRPGIYTLPVPIENRPLDVMSLSDAAHCVVNIFLRPKNHMLRSVSLTGERMTGHNMAEVMNKHFDDRKIVYHNITPHDFETFDFPGCKDLAAMFEYLQVAPPRDPRITRRIFSHVTTFDKWVQEHKEQLTNAMKGNSEE